jgi:MarR family transcriptional regulator, organic hydroperoxide resistance regulator
MRKKLPPSPRKIDVALSDAASTFVSPLSDSAGFLFRLAQIRAFDEFHRSFAGLGVTPTSFAVFALIAANPGIRPGVIADELRVKSSNVAALVNALVDKKLVIRRQDTVELRANRLYPTKAGAKAHQEMFKVHLLTDIHLLSALDEKERTRLIVLLQKLLQR